jgi:hypothetical protein
MPRKKPFCLYQRLRFLLSSQPSHGRNECGDNACVESKPTLVPIMPPFTYVSSARGGKILARNELVDSMHSNMTEGSQRSGTCTRTFRSEIWDVEVEYLAIPTSRWTLKTETTGQTEIIRAM